MLFSKLVRPGMTASTCCSPKFFFILFFDHLFCQFLSLDKAGPDSPFCHSCSHTYFRTCTLYIAIQNRNKWETSMLLGAGVQGPRGIQAFSLQKLCDHLLLCCPGAYVCNKHSKPEYHLFPVSVMSLPQGLWANVSSACLLIVSGGPTKQQLPVKEKLQQLLRKLSVPAGKQSMQNPKAWKTNRHKL